MEQTSPYSRIVVLRAARIIPQSYVQCRPRDRHPAPWCIKSNKCRGPWCDRREVADVPPTVAAATVGDSPATSPAMAELIVVGRRWSRHELHGSARRQRPLSKAGPCSLDLQGHQTLAGLTGSWASHRLLFLFAHAHASGFSAGVAGRTAGTRRCLAAFRIRLTGSMAGSAGSFLFSHISGLSGVASLDALIRFILHLCLAGWSCRLLSQCWHSDYGSKSENGGEN